MIKQKMSDLIACYCELLSGTPESVLAQRYNTIDVWAAIELKEKGYTLEELRNFVKRREERIRQAHSGSWHLDETGKVIIT